ncbi:hypothetical protein [Sulfurimonas paralvinellae]|uniref:Uncharacterized protein n=1 Tax=Sulfurimonas paralvinellae TaxID=317658 RepID=A0A7M1B4Z3_9BACT|nr:hypothetical protein [Sulfurimonas paralvinellae]QOP44801.1 hypothetical protein FM071_00175 [Sulfurimonas paralvinellae]
MKKTILSLSLLATLMFGSEYTDSLQLLNDDAKALNSYAMSSLDTLSTSQTALQEYKNKVDAYADAVANFSQKKAEDFSSKEDAQKALDTLEELSAQSVVLAKDLAYLSSHQADNASKDYEDTLASLSQTTLRLSDDIGKMSDRILVMADKIGVMADRIVETQKIQSKNLNATTMLIHSSVNNGMSIATSNTKLDMSATMQSSSAQQNSMEQNGQTQNMSGPSH